jgi:YHS domain-containing protein
VATGFRPEAMFRTLFIEFLLPLLLFFLLRSMLRNLLEKPQSRTPQTTGRPSEPVPSGGELKKDPVCGTYVSTATGFTRTIKGETAYFCSRECRDRYNG